MLLGMQLALSGSSANVAAEVILGLAVLINPSNTSFHVLVVNSGVRDPEQRPAYAIPEVAIRAFGLVTVTVQAEGVAETPAQPSPIGKVCVTQLLSPLMG